MEMAAGLEMDADQLAPASAKAGMNSSGFSIIR